MINPSRVHRSRGVIKSKHNVADLGGIITVKGQDIQTYVDLSRFELGQIVNIQVSFSIMLDQYIIKTVNKIRMY